MKLCALLFLLCYNKSMKQAGNVLFLILLAVALFAALSYAVTQSSRSGGKNASDEKARLVVAEILNYENAIRMAAQRIRMRGDYCEPHSVVPPDMVDRSSSCGNSYDGMIFHPEGGNVPATNYRQVASTDPRRLG